jgi:hypothetical protein
MGNSINIVNLVLIICLFSCTSSTENRNVNEVGVKNEFVTLEAIQERMAPIPLNPGVERDASIREMLFRYVIASQKSEKIKVWFIDYGDNQDPPFGFLQRFIDLKIKVKGISEATRDDLRDGVYDSETQQRGAIAHAEIIRWLDETKAEVKYSYYVGGLWAGGETVIVSYKDGKWVVFDIIKVWIS